MKIQTIRSSKLQQDLWKYQSVIPIGGLSMIFCHKTCHDRFVYFYKKIPKENPFLKEEVSSHSSEKTS